MFVVVLVRAVGTGVLDAFDEREVQTGFHCPVVLVVELVAWGRDIGGRRRPFRQTPV